MIAFVLGPNNSGKSAYAEDLAASLSTGALYYIATMIPYGEEGRARVEKHRRQREKKDFVTLEQPTGVSGIALPPDSVVLLEDVSNLLSNSMFELGKNDDDIFNEITSLCKSCASAVLVSIDGLEAKPEYDDATRAYIDALNRLNGRLSELSDKVVKTGK
jgi:adenosylcobinamide kinase/adenosylcobinamide-phosphate guanylyltransferase